MYTEHEAMSFAKIFFGIEAQCQKLTGECDFNFHLKNNTAEFILKISKEPSALIQLQNQILHYLNNKNLPLAIPKLFATINHEDFALTPHQHTLRLLSYLPGQLWQSNQNPSLTLLKSLGEKIGLLSTTLATCPINADHREAKWDLTQATWIKTELNYLSSKKQRDVIQYFINQYQHHALPILPLLRQSMIHGDLNDHNILIHEDEVKGFIDFGDVIKTATVCEIAIALAYVMLNQKNPFYAAGTVLKNYHAIFPLSAAEINILFDLITMRLCVSVVTAAIRRHTEPNNTYLTVSEQPAWQLLHYLRDISREAATSLFNAALKTKTSPLLPARQKYIGPNVKLAYEKPLTIIAGYGQYLFDAEGKRYLDCVNNVAHVGHCHPHVVASGQKQMSLLNTNTRYLHPHLTQYAEHLVAMLPSPLQVCFFVCSGSEANELAVRLAKCYTGRQEIVVFDQAYHGNTSQLIDLSPYKFKGPGGQGKTSLTHILPLPTKENPNPPIELIPPKPAAFIAESMLSCAGQVVLPPAYLKPIYEAIRSHGGVVIADEIQIGLGRLGSHFWGFESQGVIPDIVTMGKPLGNGHPLAAVVTTPQIAAAFANGMEYFNSFGGNPVSMAIGLAVLEVMEQESLSENALKTGTYLSNILQQLQCSHPSLITEVRGAGFFLGIEFSPEKKADVHQLVNHLREHGILLSTDGPLQNVIKIKPPLCFTKENADLLTDKLDAGLNRIFN